MVYTKLFFHKVHTEKRTGILLLAAMLFGGVCGVLLSSFQCSLSCVTLPSLQELSCFISRRQIISVIAADSVFSILLLLCSFSGHKKVFYFALFFLKGFCISYFIFLFVYFFQAHGLLFAVGVLLLHCFLLLPLQLTTVYLLLIDRGEEKRKVRVPALCASNLAAALACAVLEYFAFPAVFSSHIRF